MCCQRTKHYHGGSALLLHVCQSGCSSPPAAESLPEHPSPRTRACACVCVRPEPAASLCLLSSHCVIVHMDTAFAAVHRVLLCVGVFSARSTLLHQKLWKRLISSSSHESEHFLFTSRFTQSSLSFCSDFGLYQPMRILADAVRSHRLVHWPAARVNSSEGSCSLCFCGKRVKNVYSHAVAAMFNCATAFTSHVSHNVLGDSVSLFLFVSDLLVHQSLRFTGSGYDSQASPAKVCLFWVEIWDGDLCGTHRIVKTKLRTGPQKKKTRRQRSEQQRPEELVSSLTAASNHTAENFYIN